MKEKQWYKKWWGIVLIIFFAPMIIGIPVTIIMMMFGYEPETRPEPVVEKVVVKELTAEEKKAIEDKKISDQKIADEEAKQKLIAKQFSAWNGEHIKLTRLIKQQMNDPKSFEHIESKYWEQDDHIIVVESFR